MTSNELRLAAAGFRDAMKAVSSARDLLAVAVAVAAEADAPNAHERTLDERRQLFELRARLKSGELPQILAAAKLVPAPDIEPAVKGVK